MLDAPDADSCQILQVSGDFTGPLAGDASKRMVGLRCRMCLGFFPSCVNTVREKKKMLRFQSAGCTAKWDWVLLCPDSEREREKKGKRFRNKPDTRVVLVLLLTQRGGKMEIQEGGQSVTG